MYDRNKLTIEDELEFMQNIFDKYKKTKTKKTADYGGLKHYRLGLIGHASDIARKSERLVNLIIRKGKMNISDFKKQEETVEDTVNDLLGYVIMMLHEIEIQRHERKLKNRRKKYRMLHNTEANNE